jgi:branched-subunit amino acid transport protein
MHRIYFLKRDSWILKTVWFFGLSTLFLMLTMDAMYRNNLPGGVMSVLALQFSFSPVIFENIAAGWGEAGTVYFLTTLWIDYLYPISYALFLSLWVARIVDDEEHVFHKTHTWYVLFPIFSALFDWIENSLHAVMLSGMLPISTWGVLAASLSALFKYGLIVVSVGIILYAYSLRLLRLAKRLS